MTFQPKITIIIAVKNAKDLLAETLSSIRSQVYQPIEVVVIDGNSTDGTQKIIEENRDIIPYFVSEQDEGISDAFNKGLKLATGDYINFQGAGDLLYAPDSLSKLMEGCTNHDILICGKVMRVQENGITPIWIAPKNKRFNLNSLLFKMPLPHQGLFTHRSFFEQFGVFDKKVKFAMDYELLLRAYHQFPKTVMKSVIVSKWRAGGVGSNRIFDIFDEYDRIKKQHKVASKSTLWMLDRYSRLKYILKAKILRLSY